MPPLPPIPTGGGGGAAAPEPEALPGAGAACRGCFPSTAGAAAVPTPDVIRALFMHGPSPDYFLYVSDRYSLLIFDLGFYFMTLVISRVYLCVFLSWQDLVDKWDQNLALFSYTLEKWVNCQRSWLSLEPVFNSLEIQR